MNEIVQPLVKKTGLSEEKAAMAVDVVLGYLKEKLPSPLGTQIDNLMVGGEGMTDKLGGIISGLGGMLGRK